MTFGAVFRWLKTSSLWTYRTVLWSVFAVVFACAAVVLSLRYWVLPHIEDYRETIARVASNATQQTITIGRISADWDGLRPRLMLEDVTVYDTQQRPALWLNRVESTVSWRSLAVMQVNFHALDIYRPMLAVRRTPDGVIFVAGIALDTHGKERGGFADWLLQQPDVEVHDAAITWTDEQRGAPDLALEHADLRLSNRGRRHRFGLRAVPPSGLAAPVDIRGDLRGRSVDELASWNGTLFVQVDYADIAAWRTWIPFPVEFPRGAGAVRSWLTFSNDELKHVIADVRLEGVQTRLAPDLPELDVDAMSGRLAWKSLASGYEFTTTRLSLASARNKVALRPTDLVLRVATTSEGRPASVEFQANALDLAPIVMLSDRLPWNEGWRKDVTGLSPTGTLFDVVVKWRGDGRQPDQYTMRGRFQDVSVRPYNEFPGFAGVSGVIDATDHSGTLSATARHGAFELPRLFQDRIALDTFGGQFTWTRVRDVLDVRFHNVAFANPDAAGTVSGSYRRPPETNGELDLTGSLNRADAHAVVRYIPVTVLKGIRPWLERAFVAGKANDVKFRVKGKLADFPYPDGKAGIFSVAARLTGGTLEYADGWPRIANIDGEVQFRGKRMTVAARQGTIYNVKLANVRAEIPDLDTPKPVLTVNGEAEGQTPEFLAFIAKSPVNDMLDRFTAEMRAQGAGKLALKLVLPLNDLRETRVNGTYQFASNHIVVDPAIPALDQASGRVDFTESTVSLPGATGVFLGGPVTVSGNTQRDGTIRVDMQGRINADNVHRLGGPSLMAHFRGATDWRGAFTVRKKQADLVVESSLQGIACDLPAPFAKAANDVVPLRIERRYAAAQQQRVRVVYGEVANAAFVLRSEGERTLVERGIVRMGGGAAGEPERAGVWVTGAVKSLDFGEWLKFTGGSDTPGAYTFGGMQLKVATMDFFGRIFHDISMSATNETGGLNLAASGREFEATGDWRPEGKGRLTARFKKLIVPAAETRLTELRDKPPSKPLELPALGIVIEDFQLGEKRLGRLELYAVPENRDWRIERLRLTSPDSALTADGLWQGWLTQPSTRLSVQFDVKDIGNTLTRWHLPQGIKGGTAKVEGTLSWAGSPQEFDYPTLSGNLSIDAARGQFVKLEPGIAKLLGILSLQALPRRITLDFRDIFSEGFAFDSINGAVKINRGVASTESVRIRGPSGEVVMTGDVDLARETQTLRVRVSPHLSESVSIAGALLGGPVAGVAAFLAQKVLKDPLEQIIGFDYRITGTWADPQVAKIDRQQARSEEPTQ